MLHANAVLAHAKWFVDSSLPFPADWRFMFTPASIAMVAAVGVIAAAWIAATRLAGVADLPGHRWLTRLRPALPRLLAASLGVTLLALAVTGKFLAPHLSLPHSVGGWGIAGIEGAVGVWLLSGARLRQAAAAVGWLAVVGLGLQGPIAVLESAHMWGIAGFLWLTSAPDRRAASDRRRLGSLRLGIGVAMVAAAASEKLTNPALAAAVVEANPAMNLPQIAGLSLDMEIFVRLAGSAELLLGLLIISGATPRLLACVAAVPFVATVPLFGLTEFIGHAPIYGTLLALAVYGSASRPLPAAALASQASERPRELAPLAQARG